MRNHITMQLREVTRFAFGLSCLVSLAVPIGCSSDDDKSTTSGGRTGNGGRTGSGGSTASEGGVVDGPTSGGTSTGSGGMTSSAGTLGPWEFESAAETEQWMPGGTVIPPDAMVSWVEEGEEEPLGSMLLSTNEESLFQINILPEAMDQAHRVVSFRAKAESGEQILKPYVFSTGWKWSDGGEQTVNAEEWTTVTIDLDAPAYEGVDYDPSALINLGLQMPCLPTEEMPTCKVLIDRIWLD